MLLAASRYKTITRTTTVPLTFSMQRHIQTLESLPKTSPFINSLPPDADVDTISKINESLCKTPRQLKSGFFTYTYPTERKSYRFLNASTNALKDLNLDPINEPKSEFFQNIVSGKSIYKSENVHPFSMAYAGFQFGNFAGQLGDGRVINLFTIPGKNDNSSYELQLKGAGKTPFSRFADGNAVLRSSIREYIISEYLNSIGIPSTRALAITALPDNKAQREGAEICAIVCRMSPTWIRIGHFDYCRMKGDRNGLFKLCDYINSEVFKDGKLYTRDLNDYIKNDKNLKQLGNLTSYDKLFLEIIIRNSKSVAYWHSYGFLNGVLNTDNTSVLGLAIDFGPFAIMDKFNPNYTSNSEDHELRYSFKNTPSAIWFNMVKLAESMAEVLGAGPELINDKNFIENGFPNDESIEIAMERVNNLIKIAGDIFEKTFIDDYLKLICNRLGIQPKQSDNSDILPLLFETLQITQLEYNNFFTILQDLKIRDEENFDIETSPLVFIPENLKGDDKIEERTKILKELKTFLTIFKARCEEEFLTDNDRFEKASKYNPYFIPKNWILQDIIDYTTNRLKKGDNDENVSLYLNKVMKMANNPYDRSKWGDELKDVELKWLSDVDDSKLMTTCSCSS
jgi:uncharacterized protein YdiU (UPF0061 family)